MFIEEIIIENFRNIEKNVFFPSKNINLIVGKNAQGKTNFLESIYVVSNLKSFRGKKISELINNDFDNSKIKIKFSKNKVSNEINLEIKKEEKNIKINNKNISKFSDCLGFLNTILFYPDDILIVKGSPSLRRNLIDRAIFYTENKYLNLFQEYIRCLKQRNASLKINKSIKDVWNEKFIKLAAEITYYRIFYISKINIILSEIFSEIYKCREKVEIKYFSEKSKEDLELYFRERLNASTEKELLYGMTLTGPHRDDPSFLINGQQLSLYGSQGQQRSFMLAFKTAQIIDFKKCRGVKPVLLLDDMTSELDEDRKTAFFDSLLEQSGQVFITSTDESLLKHRRFSETKFFRVDNGKIDEYN